MITEKEFENQKERATGQAQTNNDEQKEKGDESGFEVVIDPNKEKEKGEKTQHTGTKLVDSGGCPTLA